MIRIQAAVIGALLALPAAAQENVLFSHLDRDDDGYVSEREMRSSRAGGHSWIAVDRNRDGRIGRSEFRSMDYAEALSKQPGASAGASRPVAGSAWRISELLGSPVALRDGTRYGRIDDIVVDSDGTIRVVVDPDTAEARGLYAAPWAPGRFNRLRGVYTLPYTRAQALRMEPLDYAKLGFAGPR
jgi:sporulation protein YlmC with PRC-barrel domain